MAFCRLSVDNLPHSPYNTNAYAMFVDVSVYEEVLMDIFEKCERRSRVDEADSETPKTFRGVPATLIAAAIVSMSFLGFGGLGQ